MKVEQTLESPARGRTTGPPKGPTKKGSTKGPLRRRRSASALAPLALATAASLAGCGGGSHGTMMSHSPDGGAGGGDQVGGAGGAGGAKMDGGYVDGGIDGARDMVGNDAPINLNVTIDHCPTVVAAASPSETSLDKPVAVSATGVDLEGDPLTYTWSAPTGTFAKATSSSTTYTCGQAGPVMLTVTVSDRRCDGQATVPFACQPAP